MATPELTLEENIETLKRTNLATVVTEGSEDYRFYRIIEEQLASLNVSLFPVGGRGNLLSIFLRRKELGRNNIIFLADKDLWIYNKIPDEYVHRKIIYTDGYSIENDLYRDGEIEKFLYAHEIAKFRSELACLVEWYSFALAKMLEDQPSSISEHPNRILDEGGGLCPDYMAHLGYSEKNEDLFELVIEDYSRLLRGKNLIAFVVRHLSAKTRHTKFGKHQVMEIGASRRGPCLQNIVGQVDEIMRIL